MGVFDRKKNKKRHIVENFKFAVDTATTVQLCINIVSSVERFCHMGYMTEEEYDEVKDYAFNKIYFLESQEDYQYEEER